MKKRWTTKKTVSAVSALLCVIALLIGGTLAVWNLTSHALNQMRNSPAESTLHDDFDPGTGDKDVYVENTGAATIFVRVRFDEFFDGSSDQRPAGLIDDPTDTSYFPNWKIHEPKDAIDGDDEFHDASTSEFAWNFAQEGTTKFYLPAQFQPDKGGYVQDVTAAGAVKQYPNGTADDARVLPTAPAKIMLLSAYSILPPTQKAAYEGWVYDNSTNGNGWFYWMKPMVEGDVTSVLLDSINLTAMQDKLYYYAINVVVEAVDGDDLYDLWIEDKSNYEDEDGNKKDYSDPDDPNRVSPPMKDELDRLVPPKAFGMTGGDRSVVVGNTTTTAPAAADGRTIVSWKLANPLDSSKGALDTTTGKVTGVAPGVVRIVAVDASGNESEPVSITVTSPQSPPVISGPSTVKVGSTITLSADKPISNWASSNTGVATVNATTGVVTGKVVGTAIITATAADGTTNTKTITVEPASLPAPVIGGPTTVQVGNKITLTCDKPVDSWATGDATKATVNPTTGEVTGVAAGNVTITVTATDGTSASKTITVTSAPIPDPILTGPATVAVGDTITITPDKPISTWTSSDPTKATVSPAGVVTGKAEGTVVITALATDGTQATKNITVTDDKLRFAEPYESDPQYTPNSVDGKLDRVNFYQSGAKGEFDFSPLTTVVTECGLSLDTLFGTGKAPADLKITKIVVRGTTHTASGMISQYASISGGKLVTSFLPTYDELTDPVKGNPSSNPVQSDKLCRVQIPVEITLSNGAGTKTRVFTINTMFRGGFEY